MNLSELVKAVEEKYNWLIDVGNVFLEQEELNSLTEVDAFFAGKMFRCDMDYGTGYGWDDTPRWTVEHYEINLKPNETLEDYICKHTLYNEKPTIIVNGKELDYTIEIKCTIKKETMFEKLKFEPHPNGVQLSAIGMPGHIDFGKNACMTFPNGFGVSVNFGDYWYSNGKDTYEVAITKDGKTIPSPLSDFESVHTHVTEDEVDEIMKKVEALKEEK